MTLEERISEDMKAAMKARDEEKLSTIRLLRAAIKNTVIARGKELSDEDVTEIVAREIKQRRDSLPEFERGNRPELVEKLKREIDTLLVYLPKQLTEDEVREIVRAAVAQVNPQGPKDMGKVMSAVMPQVKGKADGNLVRNLVQQEMGNR